MSRSSSRASSPMLPDGERRARRLTVKASVYSKDGNHGDLSDEDPNRYERLLATKKFVEMKPDIVMGSELTAEWARRTGLKRPVVIPQKEGTGLIVPEDFTVRRVAEVLGGSRPVNVIEVSTQTVLSGWSLDDWVEYYETRDTNMPPLNVISMEFSQTPLQKFIRSPQMVRDIDWIDNAWPSTRKGPLEYPQVQNYCLMGLAGSYTDFHIDFGGSSVWYHVLRGKKVFYFVEPTQSNLASFEKWLCSEEQETQFYGDIADVCYKVEVPAGNTLIIPTAWIHAVYTPENALVFGGNFLHSMSIPLQLQTHDLERRTHIAQKFRFPLFENMLFYAIGYILRTVRDAGSAGIEALTECERAGLPHLLQACGDLLAKAPVPNPYWDEAASLVGLTDSWALINELSQLISPGAPILVPPPICPPSPIRSPARTHSPTRARSPTPTWTRSPTRTRSTTRHEVEEESPAISAPIPLRIKVPVEIVAAEKERVEGSGTGKSTPADGSGRSLSLKVRLKCDTSAAAEEEEPKKVTPRIRVKPITPHSATDSSVAPAKSFGEYPVVASPGANGKSPKPTKGSSFSKGGVLDGVEKSSDDDAIPVIKAPRSRELSDAGAEQPRDESPSTATQRRSRIKQLSKSFLSSHSTEEGKLEEDWDPDAPDEDTHNDKIDDEAEVSDVVESDIEIEGSLDGSLDGSDTDKKNKKRPYETQSSSIGMRKKVKSGPKEVELSASALAAQKARQEHQQALRTLGGLKPPKSKVTVPVKPAKSGGKKKPLSGKAALLKKFKI